MRAFEFDDIVDEWRGSERPYLEFLRKESLSVGLYVLPAGSVDRQEPHTEDEVYYVAEGEGVINVSGEDRPVRSGSIIFVDKGAKHFFHLVTKDLALLVFFAPAEGSNAAPRSSQLSLS